MLGLVEPGFVSFDSDCAEAGFVLMRKFHPAEKLGLNATITAERLIAMAPTLGLGAFAIRLPSVAIASQDFCASRSVRRAQLNFD